MAFERGTADEGDARARIDRFLADTGVHRHGATIVPLTGDASDRRYFRVLLRHAASQVLAVHPGPLAFEALPFVNVARLLTAMPVPVPRILAHSDALGIIALEDLGDVTLQAHVGAAPPDEHAALYRQAVTFISTIQRRGRELASPDYVPYGVAFDVEKLTWELRFFTKHFLEAYRGAVLTDSVRAALAHEYASIVEELASDRPVLCHRDYHSRNLMLHDGRLYIIDFQDARMGPDTYDLASLLRDSYVDFADQQVDALMTFFLAQRAAPEAEDRDFRRRFDLMALQRNLKALGTFGFQTTSRGNTVYIQYIPRTLSYVRAHLVRYARFGRFRELLAEHLEELR
ncbi:MAG: putative phosphotransferase related to Ser/Thr protein kinase [Acidobacteria bacterium]|nr:putative phosphotransferase related to Ser/Thr protein kinase [Acidobacteriota bacterium]